jgi:hypothetical protein
MFPGMLNRPFHLQMQNANSLFTGATRKAIEERIAKLKREAKSAADPSGASVITPRKRKNSAEGEYGDEGLPTPKRKTIETLDQQAEEGLSLPNRAESPVTGSLYPLPERGESDIESGLSDIDSVIFCAERAISGKTSSEEQDEREW